MLPLWIIDITNKKSDRRGAFLRLVRQIEHVYVKPSQDLSCEEASHECEKTSVNENVGIENQPAENTLKAEIISEDRKRATRNAKIKGDYWYYSHYDFERLFKSEELSALENEEEVDNERIQDAGKCLYDFQEEMVDDARKFVDNLRKSNAKPSQPINIVVLGDASERFTQLVFSSIAAILQKEKGRFLPGHIHQGMSIVGMLYVPCDANTLDVAQRKPILRLFHEIEVQNKISTVRGYDNMMLYQDVHNRTECAYRKLDSEGLAEYLVQCLVHLYLACDINHPLLSGTGTDDVFYFSMGATSIYFDMSVEDKNDANEVAFNIVKNFKAEGEHVKNAVEVELLDKETLCSSDEFVKQIDSHDICLDDDEVRKPRVHPIKDWLHRNLKQFYYEYYLRFYPAELLRSIMRRIEEGTNEGLEKISKRSSIAFNNVETALPPAIERVIARVNRNDGGLSFVESKFKETQEYISKQKNCIQTSIQDKYWHEIIEKMKDSSFDEYHDAYVSDVRAKNSGANCNSMKQELLKNLKALLGGEKTLAATLSRSILLGILCVITFLPVLKFLSPDVINLGNVERFSVIWGLLLFAIPFAIQYLMYKIYLRKRRNLIHQLKVYFIHDAYARIANRIESEAVSFYDKMIALMEEYLTRCKDIRNEVKVITPDPTIKLLFPQSRFNQPLNGGVFDDEPLISASDIERRQIKVNGRNELVNNLTTEQYFILINHFKDGIADLFKGVSLTDSHSRRFNEELGDYEFVSREEILQDKAKEWEETKIKFSDKLHAYIKENMCDRLYPTVGDKLQQHRKKIDCCNTLEYMVAMAATNGEFASQSDTEYADVKANCDIEDFVTPYLSITSPTFQKSEYDELFKRYLFITRWRIYKNVSFNRLLPKEDFDSEERAVVNFEAEQAKAAEMAEKERAMRNGGIKEASDKSVEEKVDPYERNLSSLMLWAVCPDDNSSEWLKLIQNGYFGKAFDERQVIREIMNQDD